MEKDGLEEIFQTVNEIYPKLQQMLKQKHPELTTLYSQRFYYAMDEKYPLAMRLHNAYQILRTYCQLLTEQKRG
jgi:hypothetical protein